MIQHFAIVRRDKPAVYDQLREYFPDGSSVEVLWDRRFAERRRVLSLTRRDRRVSVRRQTPPETWSSAGYVIVRRPRE